MIQFDVLENRYEITCELASQGDLHVGSGREGEASDAGFVRRNGKAFLPGSSLRGVLRTTVERTLRGIFPTPISCVLFSGENLDPTVCMAGHELTRKKIERGDADAPREYVLCPVCRLFGCTISAGRLKITDAVQSASVPVETQVRDGVGIDRDTGAARANIKFNFDVLPPTATFRFSLMLDNAEEPELALLHILMTELKQGVHVGGKKNRGMGLVSLTGYTATCLTRSGLADFYTSGVVPALEAVELEKRTSEALKSFLADRLAGE